MEVVGDSSRNGEWALVRLVVEGDRIVSADAPGLERALAGLTLLEAAAVGGETLPVDALANALAPAIHAAADERRVAVALVTRGSSSSASQPKPVGRWTTSLAGIRSVGGIGKPTACGIVLRADTSGVSHPVIPCGAKIFLQLDGKSVLTQVIDRGPYVPGREFDLTEPLAAKLGLRGVEHVRWAYATKG